MALFEQRTFRNRGLWWIAQVEGSGGPGSPQQGPVTERIVLTCTSEPDSKSRSIVIIPSVLNKMSHRSIIKVLETAREVDFRMDLFPSPQPFFEEPEGREELTDSEGLNWILKEASVFQLKNPSSAVRSPGIDVFCLDDSALRKEVSLPQDMTLRQILSLQPMAAAAIVDTIKSFFKDYELSELEPI